MNRDINFINSDYERLFSIPDGGKICITDRNGEKNTYPCRYIDDYHFELNNRSVYHICQFAEMMERVGATYEPMEMCAVELTVPKTEEADIRRLRTNNGCIGIFRADFRSSDGRYFTSWVDKNQDLLTENFQSEFNAVINHLRLRTPFLRSEAGLKEYCRENPALIKEAPNFKSYTYKAKTDKHTYYFVVTFSQNESHARQWRAEHRDGLKRHNFPHAVLKMLGRQQAFLRFLPCLRKIMLALNSFGPCGRIFFRRQGKGSSEYFMYSERFFDAAYGKIGPARRTVFGSPLPVAWCYDSRGLEKAAREEMASKSRHTKEAER